MKCLLFVLDSKVYNRVEKFENSSFSEFVEIGLDLSLTCSDEKAHKKWEYSPFAPVIPYKAHRNSWSPNTSNHSLWSQKNEQLNKSLFAKILC